MKIVKRIFFGGNINQIPEKGFPFEHTQPNLTSIEPLFIGEYFYWVITVEYPEIIHR